MPEVKQPDPDLLAEAQERLEKQALAKSIISENDAWFKANWQEIGNLEHAGLWMGGRQKKTEIIIPSIFMHALELVLEECDFRDQDYIDLIAPRYKANGDQIYGLKPNQMKEILDQNDWEKEIQPRIDRINPSKGIMLKWGGRNVTPINSEPSTNNYAILEPGDPLNVTEPDPQPREQEPDPEKRIEGAE